jgi:hypothetical protein
MSLLVWSGDKMRRVICIREQRDQLMPVELVDSKTKISMG